MKTASAIQAINNPQQAPATAPKRRITKRMREAVRLMASGECKTAKAAAIRVGMHPNSIYRELDKPHIRAFLVDEARRTIALAVPRAASRLSELIDANSEHVSGDIASKVLAIEGIAPPERGGSQVNINITPGYVIDLSKGQDRPPIDRTAQDLEPTSLSGPSVHDVVKSGAQ